MKNKILHIYLLLILSTLAGIAQTISPTVKPSQGGSFTNGNLQMQFTIGEPLNQTFTAGGYEVSLGFQQPQPNIAIAALATGPYCAGTQISIPFTTKDMLGASTYTAQLSDSSGSFASPVSIGVDTTLGYDTITATIPATVTGGMHYRVRVVASVPVFVGGVSAYFQVIHLTATISNSGVYCSNDSINLNASPNGMASYGWSGPDSFSSTAQNPKFPASGNAGTYTVTVTTSVGCSATSSTVVIVNQAPWQLTPSFNLSGNCVGDSAFIFVPNSQQNIKYQLTLNSGVIDSLYGNTYVINFKHLAIDSNTVYNVIAYDTSDGCNLLLQPSVNISIPTGPPTPVFYQGDTVIKPDSASCYAAYSSGSFLIRYSIDSGGASIDSMSGCISGVTGNYIIRATAVTASYCASSYARLYVRVTTSGDTTHYTKLQSARSSSPMNPPVRQWEFTGGGAGIGGNWLEGLVQTSDGGYVGVGYCGTEQADLYYPDILKLSPDGIPQWHTIIQTPLSGGSVNNSAFNQIIKIQHPVNIGSVPVAYIASCQFTNSSDPYGTKQQEIFIAAFDINGNELEDGWLYNSLLGGAFYSGPNAYGRTYLGGIKETPSGNLVISGYSNTWALTASGGTNKNTDLFVCEIQQDFSHSAGGVNFVWGSVESILGSSTVSTTGLFRAESGNPALNWRGNDLVVQPTGTNYNYNLFVVGNDDQTTSSDDTRVNESGATVTVSGNKSNVSLFQFNVTEADYPSATVTTPLTTNGFPVNWPIDYDLTGLQTTTSTGFGKTYAPSITEMTNPPYKAGATPGNPTATIPIPSSGSTAVDFFGNLHQDRGYTLALDPNNAGQLIILAQVNYFQSTPNGASSIKSEAFPFNLYAGTTTTNANGGLNELPQGAMGTTEAAFCDPGIGYYTDENIVLFKVNTSSGAVTAPATEVMHCSGFDYFPRLAVDNSGYIYVTGSTGDDHNISGVYGTGPGTVDNLVGSNSRWLANVVTAMHVEKMNNDFSPYWEFTQVGHHPPVNNQEPQTALNPNGTAGPNGWEQATENPFECCFALCLNNEGGFLIGGNNFSRYQDFVIHKFYEDCEPNSYYNNAPVFSSNTTHTINLAGTDPYKGTMIIPSGTTVNISSGTMQFANSRHTIDFANFNQPISNPSKIIIQPGGTLNLTDVILEGMNNCLGQNLQWEGIELQGDPTSPQSSTAQGTLTMNNSVIRDAVIGVDVDKQYYGGQANGGSTWSNSTGSYPCYASGNLTSTVVGVADPEFDWINYRQTNLSANGSGGLLQATGAYTETYTGAPTGYTFLNCPIGAKFYEYNGNTDASYFSGCTFDVNGYMAEPINGQAGLTYHIFSSIRNLSNEFLQGCTLSNSYYANFDPGSRGFGVYDYRTNYSIGSASATDINTFQGLTTGIEHDEVLTGGQLTCQNAVFTNNQIGVAMSGTNNDYINNCTFNIPSYNSLFPNYSLGLSTDYANLFIVCGNQFALNGTPGEDFARVGTLIEGASTTENVLDNNQYSDLITGTQFTYNNPVIYYRQNIFNGNIFSVNLNADDLGNTYTTLNQNGTKGVGTQNPDVNLADNNFGSTGTTSSNNLVSLLFGASYDPSTSSAYQYNTRSSSEVTDAGCAYYSGGPYAIGSSDGRLTLNPFNSGNNPYTGTLPVAADCGGTTATCSECKMLNTTPNTSRQRSVSMHDRAVALRSIMTDTNVTNGNNLMINRISNMVTYLQNFNDWDAQQLLVPAYYQLGLFGEMNNALNAINAQNQDQQDFKSIYTLLGNAATQGRSLNQLNDSEWGTLRSFAKAVRPAAGAVAKNLLLHYKNEYYPTVPPFVKIKMIKQDTNITTLQSAINTFELYPNPNNGNAVIQYAFADVNTPGVLVISDIIGNTVARYDLNAGAGEIQLQKTGLVSGVYVCTLMQGSNQIGLQKFVKF